MVSVSASVNLPLHHKVQKFSSGTGSPGWSRKKGGKTVVVIKQAATVNVAHSSLGIVVLEEMKWLRTERRPKWLYTQTQVQMSCLTQSKHGVLNSLTWRSWHRLICRWQSRRRLAAVAGSTSCWERSASTFSSSLRAAWLATSTPPTHTVLDEWAS